MAGVSTSTSEHLPTGDDLVSTFLMTRHINWMQWFEQEVDARYRGAGGSLEILADVLQQGCNDPKCFALAFVHALSRHPAAEPGVIAAGQREHLKDFLERLAATMGLQHPEMAAAAAVLIIERTIIEIQLTGHTEETQTARLLFQCLQHAHQGHRSHSLQ